MADKRTTNAVRISEDQETFRTVYDGLLDVMASVKSGAMSVDQGEVIAKAGFGAAKVIESDLHARMFAQKVAARSATPAITAPTAPEAAAE